MKRRAGQSDDVENHDHEKDRSGPEDRGQGGKTAPSTPDHPAPGEGPIRNVFFTPLTRPNQLNPPET